MCVVQARGLSRRAALALGALFSVATPVGIVVGMLLPAQSKEGGGSLVSSCLVALAAGSFTFVAVFEILPRELLHAQPTQRHRAPNSTSSCYLGCGGGSARPCAGAGKATKASEMGALLAGFLAMALLAVWF